MATSRTFLLRPGTALFDVDGQIWLWCRTRPPFHIGAPYDRSTQVAKALAVDGIGSQDVAADQLEIINSLDKSGYIITLDSNFIGSQFDRVSRYLAYQNEGAKDTSNALIRIHNSKVTIIGLGSLGGHIAVHLACSGVGTIHLIDYDSVEQTNLSRQPNFNLDDIGKYKVDVIERVLSSKSRQLSVSTRKKMICEASDLTDDPAVARSDLIINSADKPPLALANVVAAAAYAMSKPLLHANSAGVGPLKVWTDTLTACPTCLILTGGRGRGLSKIEEIRSSMPSSPAGALSTHVASTAAIASQISIDYLAGLKRLPIRIVPSSENSPLGTRTEIVSPHPKCPHHG